MRHRDLSIRQKLIRIVLTTSGAAIVVACVVFAVYDITSFRRALANELTTLAEITGSNTTAALAFGDAKSASETLGSLSAQPHIVEACVYTADGTPFAKYASPNSDPNFVPPAVRPNGAATISGHIVVFRQIRLHGEPVGAIYLKSDLGELYARAARFAAIVFIVILTSFVAAYLLASRLQRVISEPILDLARTALAVSVQKDYTVRVTKKSQDEIGFLFDRFNEMLSRIQEREAALQAARGELEVRVNERTAELQREIAERKTAERELEERKSFLKSVIENSPVGIVAIDTEDRVKMCNPAFENLFRYREEDVLGRPLFELVASPELSPEVSSNKVRLLQGKTTHIVTRRKRSDGTLVDVEAYSVPLRAGEESTGAVLLYQDVTERKQAEAELLRAKEAAEAGSRAKSEFLANMSHEIRTPMNGIIGMTELALDTELSAEQREYLGMVKTSADSLLTLINDILDFSKIEAGKLDVDQVDFPFQQDLGETLKALALRAHQKQLELAWRVAPGIPERLNGDAGRLRQVLVNLVGNAVKFTERGEVVVSVEKESETPDSIVLHFRVIDTGVGIPKEKQQMIFDSFTQVDSSATRKYGGTGLGLAITSRLVELMGGRIWVESEPERGSTFHFTSRFGFAESGGRTLAPADPELIQNLSVLVVDDNKTNRIILVEMLSAWGMQPDAAVGGAPALAALERAHREGHPFRLVIADMQMPEMDGFGLTEKIRKSPAFGAMPILLLSSSAQQGEVARCRQLGISRYLTKPVQPSELLDAILTALAKPAEPQESLPPAKQPPRKSTPRVKVLLAEDNAVNRRLATALLEKRGYAVVATENGRESLDVLEREGADLVLMDVQMPVMDGLEAIREIRAKEQSSGAHLPIIALTAHAMKGDRERCLEAGADDYVTKPIRTSELTAAIDRCMPPRAGHDPFETPAAAAAPSKVLDLDAALERVEGDRELLEELMRLFAEEYPGNRKEIRRVFDQRDARLLEHFAHALRGSSANLGAHRVSQAAFEVEKSAHSGDLTGAAALIESLEREADLALREMETICRKVAH